MFRAFFYNEKIFSLRKQKEKTNEEKIFDDRIGRHNGAGFVGLRRRQR
jgi:hypothetical protein